MPARPHVPARVPPRLAGRPKTAAQRLSALSREDRAWLREVTARIDVGVRHANDALVRVGRDLIAVRKRIGNPLFLAFLGAKFPWSQRTAYRLMAAAEAFGSVRPAELARIDQSALYVLAAPGTPPDARAQALAAAKRGERVTHADAAKLARAARGDDPARPAAAQPGLELALDRLDELGQSGEMQFTGDAADPATETISLTFGEYKLLLRRLAPELYGDRSPQAATGPTPPPGSSAKVGLMAARAALGLPVFAPGDQVPDADHVPVLTERPGGSGRACPACRRPMPAAPLVADEWAG